MCLATGGLSSGARLRMLLENRATVVLCTPTYALHLAQFAQEQGVRLEGVHSVIVAGEPGGSVPATRARIEEAWRARVFDHSGMTEIGPLAIECRENPGGLHILEDDYYAEVIQSTPHAPREDSVTRSVTTTLDPLHVHGDRSHLQQMLENFLFNARDAISEMRNHLRKQARPEGAAHIGPLDEAHRQALIAAAGWKGRVVIRTSIIGGQPVIEVADNGIGMTSETRDHCTEPHYSTKRNNALYAGLSAGMGLGLSFVQMILEHHGATLEIESEPLKGARFRVRFPNTQSSKEDMG